MGQFSVTIYGATGSVLSDIQQEEDLDEKFKDDNDPLRLVFVCAMWITGFDVPSCSTIYLDKPDEEPHAHANYRTCQPELSRKRSGLIVDYIGVFRNLQNALAIYGGGNTGASEPPIREKEALIEYLREILEQTKLYLAEKGVDLVPIQEASGFEKTALVATAVEALIETDEAKREYLSKARAISRVYKAILPDPASSEFSPDVVLISVLAERIRSSHAKPDISAIMRTLKTYWISP